MSTKNRRIALSHAIHLAIHGSLSENNIVKKANELTNFLDQQVELVIVEDREALVFGTPEEQAEYDSRVAEALSYPVAGFRRKNAAELDECLNPAGEVLTLREVLQAGPGYLFDIGVSEKRRGKILEDIYGVCDSLEVDLMDVEEALSEPGASKWSTGHGTHLFVNMEAAPEELRADEAQDRAEPSKPSCGCENHSPYTAEELPSVRLEGLDITADTLNLLANRGLHTIGDVREAGPASLLGVVRRDISVIGSFVAPLVMGNEALEPAGRQFGGYLALPLDSFTDVDPVLIADLNKLGCQTLSDIFNKPAVIPKTFNNGPVKWLPLLGHLITGLGKEVDENQEIDEDTRASLKIKNEDMRNLLTVVKRIEAQKSAPTDFLGSLFRGIEGLNEQRGSSVVMGGIGGAKPLVIDGNSPEGQALLSELRKRSNGEDGGMIVLDQDADPAFSSMIEKLFSKSTPTKH